MTEMLVAIVTGGTRGIGRAISLNLARNGYTVVANYRSREADARALEQELQVIAPQSISVQADVSQSAEATLMITTTIERFGQLDLLVNNVGPWIDRDLVDTTPDVWDMSVTGNLSSAFYCIHAALPTMRRQRQGCIINIGAMNSEILPSGTPYSPVFGLAKAAAMLMVRNLAYSEGPYGIRVNGVSPGLIETPDYADIAQEQLAELTERIPLGRLGKPEDVAEAVSYLASEAASYVTGTILHVHGGIFGF